MAIVAIAILKKEEESFKAGFELSALAKLHRLLRELSFLIFLY